MLVGLYNILLAYGVLAPLAAFLSSAEIQVIQCVKVTLLLI